MSGQNQPQIVNQQYSHQATSSFEHKGEVDIKELFKALWNGKWTIIVTALIFSVGAVTFVLKQPNIYQSHASFIIDTNFYGSEDISKPIFMKQFIIGSEFRHLVISGVQGEEQKVDDVSISYNERDVSISITKTSQDPQSAFDGVVLFSNALNDGLKKYELQKVRESIEALMSQSLNTSDKTKGYLDELLAQQLFKKALLESPSSKLVREISKPVKPTSQINPKRTLIVSLGTLLGCMLGVAIVLVRFAFRREED